MTQYVGMNYICGFLPSRADFGSFNSFNEELIGYFPQSTDSEIDEAMIAAKKAFRFWEALSMTQRIEYFWRLSNLLEFKLDYVANAISLEIGKSFRESKVEIIESLHMVKSCFDKFTVCKPKGVVAVVAPLIDSTIGGLWCSCLSLLEGNSVIFKSNELRPMAGQIIAELFQDSGFPPGVFNLLHGDVEVSSKIILDKRVAYIELIKFEQLKKEFQILRDLDLA